MTNGDWINLPGQAGAIAGSPQFYQGAIAAYANAQNASVLGQTLGPRKEPRMLTFAPDHLVRIRENALSVAQYLMPVGSSAEEVLTAAAKIEAWLLRPPSETGVA